MLSKPIEVTKNNKCPICGKPDWCCFIKKYDDSGYEIVCMRTNEKNNLQGMDGQSYVFVRLSKMGNCVYEEYRQYLATHSQGRNANEFAFSQPKSKPLTVVDEVFIKSNTELNKIYRFMLDQMQLDDHHEEYLKKNGWTKELIKHHNVVSFPEDDYLRMTYRNRLESRNPYRKAVAQKIINEFGPESLRGIPGAFIKEGHWTFYGYSGILFPMYDLEGNVKRLRIRRDFHDVKYQLCRDRLGFYYINNGTKYHIDMKGVYTGEADYKCYIDSGGKYRTLASFQQDKKAEEEGFYINKLTGGCASGNEYSLYCHPEDDYGIVFATEGEPKGAYANYRLKNPVLTASGVTSYMQLAEENILSWCKDKKVQMYVIASDADKFEAKKKNVMDCELALIEKLKESNIVTAVAEWDESYGKGIDDCLAGGHWPTIHLV